jgi:hypothetical protein
LVYSGLLVFWESGEKKYHHCVVGKRKKCIFAGFLKWNAKAGRKAGFEPRNYLISRTVMNIE